MLFWLTVTVTVRAAVSWPSLTRTVIGNWPGLLSTDSSGVHEKAPVVAWIVAPVGAPAARL